MQYSVSKIAFIAALAAPLAAAQTVTIANLPSCALQPGISALAATGCSISDIACACKNESFITSLSTTVDQVCSQQDIETTITVAQQLCAQAGVSLVLPSVPSTSSAAASSSAAPASSSSVVTTTGTSTSTTAVAVSTTTSVAPTTPVAVGTGNIASNKTVSTAAATSSAFTGAAAVATAMSGPLAAGGIFGVAALLLAL